MKLIPMAEMLKKTKEGINEAMAPIRARRIHARAVLAKANLDEEIADLETKIQEECTTKDIDFDKIASYIDEVEMREQRKERFDEIVAQLFPDGEDGAEESTKKKAK